MEYQLEKDTHFLFFSLDMDTYVQSQKVIYTFPKVSF